ncbi:arsenic-transporting ATPase [Chryseomicrobium excrementi]|uniref:Arsenic-transporting ATPase n=1 Tax=Chryseomicrobium excrementi TaxID=2041346 RepID=A0A2M9EZR6_9BACL|nr:ArsA family ATPase [Chryseomicrobium excrementi]PJK16699.1 arsenic-transporting ATPase [Chryseomicrobium excrementi]
MESQQIVFVGGKGGVGKSTSAAAIAWKYAEQGKKTLLVSTDPAHNLGDIFDTTIGGEGKELAPNLFGLEIDPDTETTKYIDQVKQNVKGTVNPTMMQEVYRQLDTAKASPGADEAALFDKIVSIVLDEREHYDKIVFDTAPTGHTIRLLTLPELMGVWIEGLLQKREKTNENYAQLLNDGKPREDPIYDVLRERQRRFKAVRDVLLDESITGYLFVLNPERLPILETQKAVDLLHNYGIHVQTLIVNRVLPEEVEGAFMLERKEAEAPYLATIQKRFSKQKRIYIPFFARDISTKEQFERYASYL